jgi:hypothetical protein
LKAKQAGFPAFAPLLSTGDVAAPNSATFALRLTDCDILMAQSVIS